MSGAYRSPFLWQADHSTKDGHLETSEFASNPANCTALFNAWRITFRNSSRAVRALLPSWPEFRDAELAGAESKRKAKAEAKEAKKKKKGVSERVAAPKPKRAKGASK